MIGSLLLTAGKALLFGGSTAGEKGSNNVMKVLSAVGSHVDKQNYTEQERAEDNIAQIKNINDFVKQTIGENSGRSITRRELSLLIMRMAVTLTFLSVFGWLYNKEWAIFILEWFKVWWPIIGGVGVFFYGVHLLRSRAEKK